MLDTTTDSTLDLLRKREAELDIENRVVAGRLQELRELIAACSSRRVRKPRAARPPAEREEDGQPVLAPAQHTLDGALASLSRAVAERVANDEEAEQTGEDA